MRAKQAAAVVSMLVVVALVAAGCSDSGEADSVGTTAPPTDETDSSETEAEQDSAEGVAVEVECVSGDGLATAPVDTSTVALLDGATEDTAWVQRVVTIDNSSDTSARLAPDTVIRYLDGGGATIVEAALDEPYEPSLAAAAGQTVNRATIRFDVASQQGLVADSASSDQLFSSVESCELAVEPEILEVPDGEFVAPELSGQVELTDCGLTEDGSRYEATFEVQNPTESPLAVEIGFEVLAESGDRLGTGGNESDTVPAAGSATVVGFAAAFTIIDVEEAASCELLSATVL